VDINPYEAPRSEILHAADDSVELAARLRRLAAVVIDTICLVLAWLAAEWMLSRTGIEFGTDKSNEDIWSSMWAFEPAYDAFGFAVYLLIQGPLLATRAQTIGKMLLQIRIVDMQGVRGSFARIVLLRELPGWIANVTTATGLIYSLVDALLIFRRNRRCVHDLIAGTQVVMAR
jgi:uncharacterized RDD family membrane protein YckC